MQISTGRRGAEDGNSLYRTREGSDTRDSRAGQEEERPSQHDLRGFGISMNTSFTLDFHYFLRTINLAGAVSIGTPQQRVVMNGALTVSERDRNQLPPKVLS